MTPDHPSTDPGDDPDEAGGLHAWLRDQPPQVPPGFEQQVMAVIHREPVPARAAHSGDRRVRARLQRWLTCGVLTAAAVAGFAEFITFLFAIWTASAAG